MIDGESRTGRITRSVETAVERVSNGSVLVSAVAGAVASVESAVRESYCYRWLTAEPDPEVIVIDLRETYTVGPIIELLDRLVTPFEAAWEISRLQAVTNTLENQLAGSGVGRLVGKVLTPPEMDDRSDG